MPGSDEYQLWVGVTSRHVRRRWMFGLARCGLCCRRWPCPEVRAARAALHTVRLRALRSWWSVLTRPDDN